MSNPYTDENSNPSLPFPVPPLPISAPLAPAASFDANTSSWITGNALKPKGSPNYNFEVNVAFLNGTAYQKDKVIKYSKEWLKYAPVIKFRFVRGIHGHVRVAFDDEIGKDLDNDSDDDRDNADVAIRDLSWSQTGRYSQSAISTPETLHVGQVDDTAFPVYNDKDPKIVREKRVIQHTFGHALGLRYPKPNPALGAWTDVAADKATILKWAKDKTKEVINRPDVVDPKLNEESVLAFRWRYDITKYDKIAISKLYPIHAKVIRFSIQDFFEKSLNHENDVDIYVLDKDGYIFHNRRNSVKTNPKLKGNVGWSNWTRLLRSGDGDPLDLAVLDLNDRLEFLIIERNPNDKSIGTLKVNFRLKNTKKWNGWQQVGKKAVKKIKLLQIQDGYEVFVQTSENKLEHFTRRNGDVGVPKENHPIPGTNVNTIHAARVGPATNPIQIYTAQGLDISAASLATPALTWSLSSLAIDKTSAGIKKLEFATVGDTRHAFIIDDNDKLFYNRSNDQGWYSWNAVDLPKDVSPKILTIAAGVVSSNDKENDYIHVFIRDKNKKVRYNRVDVDGNWGWPNDDAWRDNFPGVKFASEEDAKYRRFPLAEDVQTKRTKSGDLEVFFITAGGDAHNPDLIARNRLDSDGWNDKFEFNIWGL